MGFKDTTRIGHFDSDFSVFRNRRAKLHPQKQRSKYIAKPDAVVEAGNHFVWEFVSGRGSLNVPANAGILHHYRVSESFLSWNLSVSFEYEID